MLDALSLLVKVGLYSGLVGAVGLAIQGLVLGAEFRRLITLSALVLSICVAARLFLLNAELAGGLQHAFDFTLFDWVWSPNKLQTLGYLAGSGAVLIGLLLRIRILVLLGAITLLASIGLGGHTRGLESPGLNPWIASLHVGLAAFWVTAPIALWPYSNINDTDLLEKMQRFSTIALVSVPVLFVSGFWLSLLFVGSLEALVSTTYGRVLAIKVGLATLALLIGALNKTWVAKCLEIEPAEGRVLLRRTLLADCLLFLGIIVAIAVLTTVVGPST